MIKDVRRFAASKGLNLPLYGSRVQAGVPSPADDHVEEEVNLLNKLVKNPRDTFLVRVTGDSMIDAGIREGSLLVVDRAEKPRSGKIVIAVIEGQLTVKFLTIRAGKASLMPANPKYPAIPIDEESGVTVWGVVTNCIQSF
jgi:DNA polymerase V